MEQQGGFGEVLDEAPERQEQAIRGVLGGAGDKIREPVGLLAQPQLLHRLEVRLSGGNAGTCSPAWQGGSRHQYSLHWCEIFSVTFWSFCFCNEWRWGWGLGAERMPELRKRRECVVEIQFNAPFASRLRAESAAAGYDR